MKTTMHICADQSQCPTCKPILAAANASAETTARNRMMCALHCEPECSICYPALKSASIPYRPGPRQAIAERPTLLSERGTTHGVYAEQANITQTHRAVLRQAAGWERLSNVQKDALEMISVKISRILTGDPSHRDHWEDIAGYATLAANGGKGP